MPGSGERVLAECGTKPEQLRPHVPVSGVRWLQARHPRNASNFHDVT
jgi:hypothetical protein